MNPIGLGELGDEQLDWLKNDLKHRSKSDKPIVVFAHIPLVGRLCRIGVGARKTARGR